MKAMLTPLYKQKNVRLLWGAQALQSFSQILLTVAVIADVYERANHSVLGAASVLACMSAAGFLGGLFASRHIQQFSIIGLLHGIGWARLRCWLACRQPVSWAVSSLRGTFSNFPSSDCCMGSAGRGQSWPA
ncbi:hypothetical protein [Brevibacillus marinus]|uniref:hypothetical protein n=1 Tax=Brevibacillus marinus TaxID=2496837 RepID=UPI0013DF8F47|nr:hypothetical protein [Brevibacillus marinus]